MVGGSLEREGAVGLEGIAVRLSVASVRGREKAVEVFRREVGSGA